MKEQNLDNNNMKIDDYNLSKINEDNDIEFDLSKIITNQESIKNSLQTQNEKMVLNYSLIIKNVIENINDFRRERYYEDEFKINLLLMSSLKNIHLKLICLNILLRFNDKKEFSSLINYILTKVWRYQNQQNSNLNKINLIYILKSSSKILYQQKNYFYSFYFLWNAKKLIQKEGDTNINENDYEDINKFWSKIKEEIQIKIYEKCNFLKSYSQKNLENVNKILDDILVEKKIEYNTKNNEKNIEDKDDIDEENMEYGTYNFLINKEWITKAKKFINYYIISKKEPLFDDEAFKEVFETNNILNSYFNLNSSEKVVYPGPINNFNLIKYKDCWEDPNDEDENFYFDKNSKEYISINEKKYNILKYVFESTNDIKILEKDFDFFELKVLILDKRFREIVNQKLLRLRAIKARKKIKLTNFELKIIRCVYYEIKKLHKIDDSKYYEYDNSEDADELNRIIKNSNFSFYLVDKENKNVLIEICIAYMKNFQIYNTCYIHQLSYSEEKDTLETLLSKFDKSKHYLIIEISDKSKETFLKEIIPNTYYEFACSICEKIFKENEKYLCDRCNMSIFCSKSCSNKCGEHKKFHKIYFPFLKEKISINLIRKKLLSYNAFSNEGIVGLNNFGNTCYINCIIQCLSNTEDFNKFFVFDFYKNEINYKYLSFEDDIVELFAEVLKKLWQENISVCSPKQFLKKFFNLNKQFVYGEEQDVQEFLSTLLNNLHESLNRAYYIENNDIKKKEKENINIEENYNEFIQEEKKRNKSFIYDLFTGYYLTKTICEKCQKQVINFESFNTLSLPIPKNHLSFNIKYFTNNGVKTFPFSMNENSSFINLKEKALYYFEKDLINKIKKTLGNNIYNLLNKESNNCIYNYNVNKIPKKMLLNYIDIIILEKNKSIYDHNINDKWKIFQYLKLKDYDYYEIVLYEKNLISNDYINIYIQASYYNTDKKLFFFKSSEIINYSYPILLSVDKEVSLKSLNKTLFKKFEIILKSARDIKKENGDINGNLIELIIPHRKTTSNCPFCNKNYEQSEFCKFEDLFEKNNTILSLINNQIVLDNNDNPLILVANSKYFEIEGNYLYNTNILFIDSKKEMKMDKEINLFDCLEKFSEEEILDNNNKWFCERCKVKQIARRKILLYKTPPYLIIQLKRFKYSGGILAKFFERNKNETQVIYPEILDLKEYISGDMKNDSKYELYAFVLHSEHHYVSVCKNRGRWILYDDHQFKQISFKQSKNTYLLFYKKI